MEALNDSLVVNCIRKIAATAGHHIDSANSRNIYTIVFTRIESVNEYADSLATPK